MKSIVQRILFATDFSEGATGAQQHLLLWAKEWDAEVTLLHVVEVQPGMNLVDPVVHSYVEAQRAQTTFQLTEISAWCTENHIPVGIRTNVGTPSQSIVDVAKFCGSDVIMMGTRGMSGLEHLFVGSTAERVIRMAPCPVMAVPDIGKVDSTMTARPLDAAPRYQRIALPVDFSDCSLDALEYAIQVTKKFGATLHVLHVLEPESFGLDFTLRQVEERHHSRDVAESWLSELTTSLRGKGIETTYQVLGGLPRESIISRIREDPSDLMVIGTHGRKGLSRVACGSVAEYVLRHIHCPVLTVKSPKFAPEFRTQVPERPAQMFQWLPEWREAYGVDS